MLIHDTTHDLIHVWLEKPFSGKMRLIQHEKMKNQEEARDLLNKLDSYYSYEGEIFGAKKYARKVLRWTKEEL